MVSCRPARTLWRWTRKEPPDFVGVWTWSFPHAFSSDLLLASLWSFHLTFFRNKPCRLLICSSLRTLPLSVRHLCLRVQFDLDATSGPGRHTSHACTAQRPSLCAARIPVLEAICLRNVQRGLIGHTKPVVVP